MRGEWVEVIQRHAEAIACPSRWRTCVLPLGSAGTIRGKRAWNPGYAKFYGKDASKALDGDWNKVWGCADPSIEQRALSG